MEVQKWSPERLFDVMPLKLTRQRYTTAEHKIHPAVKLHSSK